VGGPLFGRRSLTVGTDTAREAEPVAEEAMRSRLATPLKKMMQEGYEWRLLLPREGSVMEGRWGAGGMITHVVLPCGTRVAEKEWWKLQEVVAQAQQVLEDGQGRGGSQL
jgi:hypothetical protein